MTGKTQFNSVSGKLLRVSSPKEIKAATHQTVYDVYMLGMKTSDGKRIILSLNTTDLGWFGDEKSKVFWWNEKRRVEIRTSIKNPERYIGTTVRVEGILESINIKTMKYRL
ncbi:MAG: hypothetical protein ACTSVZ_05080, partial [Promethearchaeota archaeon]